MMVMMGCSLCGSAFKYPTLAFISTYQKKVFTRNEKGIPKKFEEPVHNFEDAETSVEDADTSPSCKKDINGLRFAPSCDAKCFIGDKRCTHKNWFNVELNHVETMLRFPLCGGITAFAKSICATRFSTLLSCLPLLILTLVVMNAV
jgi:hypothetical protein